MRLLQEKKEKCRPFQERAARNRGMSYETYMEKYENKKSRRQPVGGEARKMRAAGNLGMSVDKVEAKKKEWKANKQQNLRKDVGESGHEHARDNVRRHVPEQRQRRKAKRRAKMGDTDMLDTDGAAPEPVPQQQLPTPLPNSPRASALVYDRFEMPTGLLGGIHSYALDGTPQYDALAELQASMLAESAAKLRNSNDAADVAPRQVVSNDVTSSAIHPSRMPQMILNDVPSSAVNSFGFGDVDMDEDL